jgi:2-dehydropantoate 2-reductase
MRIAVLGGAGAMGSVFGGSLARAGHDVVLIDVWEEAVQEITRSGLTLESPDGSRQHIRVKAASSPNGLEPVDLVLVFVKCYQTEAAVRAAIPLLAPSTIVLTLQNGWGNGETIARLVGQERVLVGVTYHSATVLGPGHVRHTGRGPTYLGGLDARVGDRAHALTEAGLPTTATAEVVREIWAKLALNACTLPTAALLGFRAGQLLRHEGTRRLMRALLEEVVLAARAAGIELDSQEQWEAMCTLLSRAADAKPSMLQDVERRRRTEIEVINGAVVRLGEAHGIPTPCNRTMVWLVSALEETFQG